MPRTLEVSAPEMAMIVGTRVLLGIGIGLLVAERIDPRVRRGAAWTMLLVGVASTIPLSIEVLSGRVRRIPATTSKPISQISPSARLPESPW